MLWITSPADVNTVYKTLFGHYYDSYTEWLLKSNEIKLSFTQANCQSKSICTWDINDIQVNAGII